MADPTTTDTPAEGTDPDLEVDATAEEVPTVAQGDTEPAEATDERPSRREARYRRQLRAAEAERDQLAERLDAMRRAEVERIAADVLAKPAGLWAAGTGLGDLLDADGNVDAAAVRAAAETAQAELGLGRARPSNYMAAVGSLPYDAHRSTFEAAFGPR